MSLINDEQRAELEAEVTKANLAPEEAPSDTLAVRSDGSVQEVKSPTEDVQYESADSSEAKTDKVVNEKKDVDSSSSYRESADDVDDKSHKVPYNRFRSVLEARNKFRDEASSYEEKIANLEKQLVRFQNGAPGANGPGPPEPVANQNEERSWLDEFLNDDQPQAEVAAPQWQSQYDSLNKRLHQFEVAKEQDNLSRELKGIEEKYTNVNKHFLLKAVISNPEVDLDKLAGEYDTWISSTEESAIARYLEDNKAGEAPKVPPRPRSTGSSPKSSITEPAKKPSTLKDATNALRSAFKDGTFKL